MFDDDDFDAFEEEIEDEIEDLYLLDLAEREDRNCYSEPVYYSAEENTEGESYKKVGRAICCCILSWMFVLITIIAFGELVPTVSAKDVGAMNMWFALTLIFASVGVLLGVLTLVNLKESKYIHYKAYKRGIIALCICAFIGAVSIYAYLYPLICMI